MPRLKTSFRHLLRDTSGASAVEYALIVALISVGAMVFMAEIGTGVKAAFREVCTTLSTNIADSGMQCPGE